MRCATTVSALALTALVAVPAAADSGRYVSRTFAEPASAGLPVSGKLSDFEAYASTRLIVPSAWARRSATRFVSTRGTSCHYDITVRVSSQVTDDEDAETRVAAALPSPGAHRVLDAGRRGSGAFRVVRPSATGGRVRLEALWTGVLTRRDDVAGDRTAWADVRVTALSRRGDECHSGTYRQALGPQIGDALAAARATLHFRKG